MKLDQILREHAEVSPQSKKKPKQKNLRLLPSAGVAGRLAPGAFRAGNARRSPVCQSNSVAQQGVAMIAAIYARKITWPPGGVTAPTGTMLRE